MSGELIEFVVDEEVNRRPLQDALCIKLGLSKKAAKALIDRRQVAVNSKTTWIASHVLRLGDRVLTPKQLHQDNQPLPIPILWRDIDFAVVNKPSSYLSKREAKERPDLRSLEEELPKLLGWPEARVVHRLDYGTSGALLVAKDRPAFEQAKKIFSRREVKKEYRLLAWGRLKKKNLRCELPIGRQEATTDLSELQFKEGISLISAKPITGRTHQIRIHLEKLGLTIIGDTQYGESKRNNLTTRLMLHSSKIELSHPTIAGQRINVEAPLPRDFVEFLASRGLDR